MKSGPAEVTHARTEKMGKLHLINDLHRLHRCTVKHTITQRDVGLGKYRVTSQVNLINNTQPINDAVHRRCTSYNYDIKQSHSLEI